MGNRGTPPRDYRQFSQPPEHHFGSGTDAVLVVYPKTTQVGKIVVSIRKSQVYIPGVGGSHGLPALNSEGASSANSLRSARNVNLFSIWSVSRFHRSIVNGSCTGICGWSDG